jgi:hypothetical protein
MMMIGRKTKPGNNSEYFIFLERNVFCISSRGVGGAGKEVVVKEKPLEYSVA